MLTTFYSFQRTDQHQQTFQLSKNLNNLKILSNYLQIPLRVPDGYSIPLTTSLVNKNISRYFRINFMLSLTVASLLGLSPLTQSKLCPYSFHNHRQSNHPQSHLPLQVSL